LEAVADLDMSRLTHLHDLNLLHDVSDLKTLKLPALEWVELQVRAGPRMASFQALLDDATGLFAAARHTMDLCFVGRRCSRGPRARARAGASFLGKGALHQRRKTPTPKEVRSHHG